MMENEISYAHRPSMPAKNRIYRLNEDSFTFQDDDGDPVIVPYSSIGRVEAEFSPLRVQPNRYFLHLYAQTRGKIDITNTHYKGIGDFEDRSESYVPFVTALHKKILEHNPGASFIKAASWGGLCLRDHGGYFLNRNYWCCRYVFCAFRLVLGHAD